jgi:hypothetical protein
MAEQTLVKETDSILAQETRNSILSRTQIISLVKNEVATVQNNQSNIDSQNAEIIKEQQNALSGFNSSILAIRDDIGKLNNSLTGVSFAIQQDATEEQNRIRAQQEQERLLAERQIRIGKESEIEKKIQNAVVQPVEKLTPQIKETFGGINIALTALFGGWITANLISAISSNTNKSSELFTTIKDSIGNSLKLLTGGLSAIGSGFSVVQNILSSITKGIKDILKGDPLEFLRNLIPGLKDGSSDNPEPSPDSGTLPPAKEETSNQGSPAQTQSPAPPAPPSAPPTFSPSSESPAAPSGASTTSIVVMSGTAATTAGVGTTSTTTRAPNAQITPVLQTSASDLQSSSTNTQATPGPTPATATPQETMMGQPAPQTSTTPPLTPERIAQFEKAWKYKDFPGAKGQIREYWNKLSPQEQIQAKQWVDSKGYAWSQLGLPDPTATTATTTAQTSQAQITPNAQVTAPPREAQQVGETPQPAPTITVVPLPQAQSQQSAPPTNNIQITDVPMINSSNPDNFYVLYSQLNYNVVT